MQIPSKVVHEVLTDNGVTDIHHANSVLTACQFLRAGALLSRGTIERRDLFQTAQSSDDLDQKFSLWFDVFTDSVDIHQRAGRANAYGPALLVLDVSIIKEAYTGGVWVTKLNPTKWEGKKHEERWFTSPKDLRENFVRGRFDQMVVFRHCGGELPLGGYLKEIILDDPNYKSPGNIDIHSMARGALILAKTEGSISAKISKRKCQEGCRCLADYKKDRKRMLRMFLPKE